MRLRSRPTLPRNSPPIREGRCNDQNPNRRSPCSPRCSRRRRAGPDRHAEAGAGRADEGRRAAAAPRPGNRRCRAPAAPRARRCIRRRTFDFLLKERMAQGQPDTPELRATRSATSSTRASCSSARRSKKNLDRTTPTSSSRWTSRRRRSSCAPTSTDWMKNNPIPDAELRKEYDAIKSQIGDKEYKVAHILVEKEDEAKEVIAELQKGGKFDELAKARSKDPGSKDRAATSTGTRPANFVKPFGDAMVKTAEGQVHAAAGADAVRLARDPRRRRPRREGAAVRRGEAAAVAAHAGAVARPLLRDLRAEERRVAQPFVRARKGAGHAACPFALRARAVASLRPARRRDALACATRSSARLAAPRGGGIANSIARHDQAANREGAWRSSAIRRTSGPEFLFIVFGRRRLPDRARLRDGQRRPHGTGLLPARRSGCCSIVLGLILVLRSFKLQGEKISFPTFQPLGDRAGQRRSCSASR